MPESSKHATVFGCALAMVISWGEHHSILWAIIQGLLGWIYVLWYAIWGRPHA